jgi:hypothetical protein
MKNFTEKVHGELHGDEKLHGELHGDEKLHGESSRR